MNTLKVLVKMMLSLFGFAGGGGSSSGGGGGGGGGGGSSSFSSGGSSGSSGGPFDFVGFLVVVLLFIVLFVAARTTEKLKENWRKKHPRPRSEYEHKSIDQNNTEQEKWIHQEAERIFLQYQKDWSENNLEGIRSYTTDNYYQHASLMLDAIAKMKRNNVVSNLSIARTVLFTPVTSETQLPIKVQLMFRFGGTDGLVSTDTGDMIYSYDAHGLDEYWDFIYDGSTLKLNGITQSTESTPHLIESIAEFAKANNLFYSPDWGRLALPTEGLIFDGYNVLAEADVNNHVVGKWNNCLVQIYTYSAVPGEPDSYYIVGQISVPKSYKGVIVEAKKSHLKLEKPKDYDKHEMEWGEFNRRYNVFAASSDALPAFELLNPAFMERLYERNLPYSLEVKDNVIYIFAKVKAAQMDNYAELLNVLSEAFKELKM